MLDDADFFLASRPSTVGMVLCFGTITFTATAMAARTFLLGDSRAIVAASNFKLHHTASPFENSFVSVFVLLYHFMLMGLFLLSTYIIQHHPPFPHGDRASFDPDYLAFLCFLMILFAFANVRRNDGRDRNFDRQNEQIMCQSKKVENARYDEGSTIVSALPSIATRRSVKSENSNISGKSAHSGVSAGGSTNVDGSVGSIEDVDLDEAPRKSNFLDSLEMNSNRRRGRVADSSADIEHVNLLDEEGSMPTVAKTTGSRSRVSVKSGFTSVNSSAGAAVLDVLNVSQSLEWKGILSALFLIYQLTDAVSNNGNVNLFYNASQVGASCFVFMTGFGHAMYFYTRNNFRLGRVLRVLFRLNLTAFLLCATMNRPYILYYVCPLHSMAFLMTYGIMKVQQDANYSKYGLRMKMLVLVAVILCMWDFDLGLFDLLFSPFFSTSTSVEGLPDGPLWAWYSQSHMHHWISFTGIVYAINYPITSLLLNKMESLSIPLLALAKSTVGGSLLIASAFWTIGPFAAPKFVFDSTHSYFAFLPVLSFVYFRNVTPFLRQHHLTFMKTMGKCSLEIYLFHHYFFLADDGVSTLILLPGYPKCNIIFCLSLLLLVSRTVHNLTSILSGMMFPPDDDNKCIRSLIAVSVCSMGFYCVAYVLDSMELTGANTITMFTLLFGLVCYQIIMAMTWTEYKNVGRQLSLEAPRDEETSILRASPPIIGTMVILVIGVTWNILSMAGASGGSEPLTRVCEAYANEGIWAPVNPCNEYHRGINSRDLSVGGYYGECEDGASMHWGWRQPKSNLKCRFRSRTATELRQKLARRKIVFVGDLTVRSLYHALCRLLGDTNAGKYDSAVADHADMSKGIGSTRLEYKWAPLAFDQVSKLRDIRTKGNSGQKQADLLIVGGGALDRLHVWATDEDQDSHKVAVQKLSKELEFTSAPSIWCTPTTINTPALGNDEKRNQMNEMAISEMRKMYVDLDVEESADFVLDGPSYSRGRVSESYDGVLYPANVYDVGIQIIANSLDWLLPEADNEEFLIAPPPTGSLSNPFLGVMMACFGMIGLFFFDGYLGFSYLSSLLIRKEADGRTARPSTSGAEPRSLISAIMPNDLYDEAFVPYHQRLKLPFRHSRVASSSLSLGKPGREKKSDVDDNQSRQSLHGADILSLLDNDSLLGSGGSQPSRTRRSVVR